MVTGTVTEAKRPGKVKGKGEIFLRFDSLTYPTELRAIFARVWEAPTPAMDSSIARKARSKATAAKAATHGPLPPPPPPEPRWARSQAAPRATAERAPESAPQRVRPPDSPR